ncbi:uncharacterized protein [Amphiura filiformis]|uniref:uncharacterized protein n=1 Tax=Amphiura filiformis TaxID=82378 RepID=UPI003B20C011
MATLYLFITFVSMLVLCQHAFAVCPTSLFSYRRIGSVCNDYLDCSYKVQNRSPLADTLLDNAEVQDCVKDTKLLSYSQMSGCPPSGPNSGISHSDIPSNGCSFCFKIVFTRLKVGPAFAKTACTRKKREETECTTYAISSDPTCTADMIARHMVIAVVNVPEQGYANVTVEKIGPDPVRVYYMYTIGGPGGVGPPISFGWGYQQMPLTFGPITTLTEIQLINPSYGVIGVPGILRIIPGPVG